MAVVLAEGTGQVLPPDNLMLTLSLLNGMENTIIVGGVVTVTVVLLLPLLLFLLFYGREGD